MATLLVQKIKRPYWVASVVLHGLLLLVPLASPPSTEAPPTKPIKLTRLPLAEPSPVPLLKPSPIRQPSPLPNPSQILPSSVPPLPSSPPSPRASRVNISPSPPSPAPVAATPIPSPPSPSPSPSSSPDPLPTPLSTPSPSPTIPPDPFAGFPHVSGAQAGCAGSERCWQTADTQWRSIAVNIQQDLQDKGYVLDPLPLADETGRQVYRVSKAGEEPYYLSFISTPQGTIYSSTERPMTPEEMNILSGV
ncbi:MAG: hypothetical protein KME11_20815 [Timaviella obliquedivisa GSE-PSE-MK23-08B]|nr:hypothetical protein [Timaviella obliquedivisa GSE-PSE-MK23-08B]